MNLEAEGGSIRCSLLSRRHAMACCGFLILSDGEEGQACEGGFHSGVLLCRLVMMARVLRWTTSGLMRIVLHLLTKYTLHGKTCRRPEQRRRRGRIVRYVRFSCLVDWLCRFCKPPGEKQAQPTGLILDNQKAWNAT